MNESFIHQRSHSLLPRNEAVNKQIRQESKEKILDAARRVFARKGTAATMSEVAKEAGISQGLAYRYFPSKEAILTALVEQMAASGGGAAERVKRIPGSPGERLALMLSFILESRRSQPEFYQLLYKVLYDDKAPDGLREVVMKSGQIMTGTMRHLIIEGQATGEIAKDDPDQLLGVLSACLDGLSRGMVALPPDAARKSIPQANVIMRMLRPDPPSAKQR
jgi:AcrR family transcriptional regulator